MVEEEEKVKFTSDPNANDEEGDETHRHNDNKSIKGILHKERHTASRGTWRRLLGISIPWF